jgi:hypothetical protein
LVTGASQVTVHWKTSSDLVYDPANIFTIVAGNPTVAPVYCLGDHGFNSDLGFLPGLGMYRGEKKETSGKISEFAVFVP